MNTQEVSHRGYDDRLRQIGIAEVNDVGGTELRIWESTVRDLASTVWGLDTSRRVVFPGDGFAYSHYNGPGHRRCGAEESSRLPIPETSALFAEPALCRTRFTDTEPYADRFEEFLGADLGPVRLIAQPHACHHGYPRQDAQDPSRFEWAQLDGRRPQSCVTERRREND